MGAIRSATKGSVKEREIVKRYSPWHYSTFVTGCVVRSNGRIELHQHNPAGTRTRVIRIDPATGSMWISGKPHLMSTV
jgi:hypothetical protein